MELQTVDPWLRSPSQAFAESASKSIRMTPRGYRKIWARLRFAGEHSAIIAAIFRNFALGVPTNRSTKPYPWPPKQAQPDVSKPGRGTHKIVRVATFD